MDVINAVGIWIAGGDIDSHPPSKCPSSVFNVSLSQRNSVLSSMAMFNPQGRAGAMRRSDERIGAQPLGKKIIPTLDRKKSDENWALAYTAELITAPAQKKTEFQ